MLAQEPPKWCAQKHTTAAGTQLGACPPDARAPRVRGLAVNGKSSRSPRSAHRRCDGRLKFSPLFSRVNHMSAFIRSRFCRNLKDLGAVRWCVCVDGLVGVRLRWRMPSRFGRRRASGRRANFPDRPRPSPTRAAMTTRLISGPPHDPCTSRPFTSAPEPPRCGRLPDLAPFSTNWRPHATPPAKAAARRA
jgi:hypothetical protein